MSKEFEAQKGKPTVVAVRRNGDQEIAAVKLSDGRELDIKQAINEAEANNISGVRVGATRGNEDSRKTLRGVPDGDPSNNLSNLPEF